MAIQPLRSVLYMPGANQRAMDKARGLPVDAIVFDLEDAVAPDAKANARVQVVAQLGAGGYGKRQLVVRCNALSTPWGEDDVRALAATSVDVLCFPKVENPAEILAIETLLAGLGRSDIALWAMIETPEGVASSAAIAACERVTCLVMGTTDLASELRVPHRADRLGLQYALGQCVLAARRHGKSILDGVYLALDDPSGYRAICEQGVALGFNGKTLIHPSQVAAANEVFGFSPDDIERAQRIVSVWEEAEAAGKGVAVLDGKLIELMHVEEARRLLDMAQWMADGPD